MCRCSWKWRVYHVGHIESDKTSIIIESSDRWLENIGVVIWVVITVSLIYFKCVIDSFDKYNACCLIFQTFEFTVLPPIIEMWSQAVVCRVRKPITLISRYLGPGNDAVVVTATAVAAADTVKQYETRFGLYVRRPYFWCV